MSAESRYGQTVVHRAKILPELTLDMLEGRPTPPELGKTHTPVHILPPLALDMLVNDESAILQLSISFRADATPAQIGRDYHRLFAILNNFDLAQGGSGISPIEAPQITPIEDTDVRLAFRLSNPLGRERRVSAMIQSIESATIGLGSIVGCKVQIAA